MVRVAKVSNFIPKSMHSQIPPTATVTEPSHDDPPKKNQHQKSGTKPCNNLTNVNIFTPGSATLSQLAFF